MKYCLKEASIEEIEDILVEAYESKAFLPRRQEPDFNVCSFIKDFRGKKGFYAFGLREDNSCPVGFITVLPVKDPEVLYIGPMYIKGGQRGKGFGRLQVLRLIEWARPIGYKRVKVMTWGENKQSRRIFENMSFTVLEELPDQRINGDSSVKYLLEL